MQQAKAVLMSELSFASEVYLQMKSLWRGRKFTGKSKHRRGGAGSAPYSKGRDPRSLGDVLAGMSQDMGWTEQLSQSLLLTEWADLVGQDIALHTEVMSIEEVILHVQCDSTPWATQLRRMRHQIVTKITEVYPEAGIEDIVFHGPHTPSWRHGVRRVAGRGPRDTYG